jgi:hypothetical protein
MLFNQEEVSLNVFNVVKIRPLKFKMDIDCGH